MEKVVMADHLAPKVQWSLTDEGMGILERAGLAGLYLSLTAAEEWAVQSDPQAQELRKILAWKLGDQSVKLWWEGKDLPALTKLVEWAWQNEEGVVYLPGLHRSRDEREHQWMRLDIHTGLLQTFFQHNRVLPRDKNPTNTAVTLDEGNFFNVTFRRITGGLPQKRLLRKILRKGIGSDEPVSLPSWVFPGAARRFGKTAGEEDWTGTPKLAFVLLFAPLASVYFELPKTKARTKVKAKKKSQMRPNWAFLIPDIDNLMTFSRNFFFVRQRAPMDFLRVRVQGLGDAALRFASAYAARDIERTLKSRKVYVVAMGQVSHYQGQNVRKRLLEFTPSETSIRRYNHLMKHLRNVFRPVPVKHQLPQDSSDVQTTLWIWQPSTRGRIADNLVRERPWYEDLLWPPAWQLDELEGRRQRLRDKGIENVSLDHLWFNNLHNERRALMELAKEKAMWDSPEEKDFLTILHHTLRQLLNKEGESQKRGGSRNLQERWMDRVDDIRRGLMRAKTRELSRKLLVEFLAEGGGGKELTEKKGTVWRFLNHPYDWQKARDLALLALVTFTDKRLGIIKESPEQEEESSDE